MVAYLPARLKTDVDPAFKTNFIAVLDTATGNPLFNYRFSSSSPWETNLVKEQMAIDTSDNIFIGMAVYSTISTLNW